MLSSVKVRQSNIELLRIVAIFLVMVGHFNSGMGGGRPHFEGVMDGIVIGRNLVGSFASICVVLFVLISGWFSIKPNLKSIATLWTQIFFINLYMIVLQVALNGGGINIKSLAICFLPFILGNWFVKSYLILMLLSPALNILSDKLSKKGLLLFLIVFSVMGLAWGCIWPTEGSGFNKGMSPVTFIYVYMAGRFMRKHPQPKQSKWIFLGGYFLLSFLIFVGLMLNQDWMLYYCNPMLVLSAISLFYFFVKWDFGYNRFINWVATSVFAVFIFHTHPPVSTLLTDFNIQMLNTLPYIEYLGLMFVVLVGVFLIAVLMDKVRAYIFKPVISFACRIEIMSDNNEKLIKLKSK